VLDHGLENALVGYVIDPVAEWEVDSIVLSGANTNVAKFAGARKIFAVLVEGHGHDSVGSVERLLDTVSVVYVNIDVEDSLLVPKQLKDTEYDICTLLVSGTNTWWRNRSFTVDITEATCFTLFRVVQASCPVDGDVALIPVQPRSALHAATCADPAELEKAVKDRTVVTNVISALLSDERVHIIRGHLGQEVDVFVGVELRHFVLGRGFCALERMQR
jgi:hypothetical protein